MLKHTQKITDYVPSVGERPGKYGGKEIIKTVGEEMIREAVASILCGGNVRSLTEGLTRTRLAISNAALFVTFLQSQKNITGFIRSIPKIIEKEISGDISKENKLILQWCAGLTEKGIQNILRSDRGALGKYLDVFEQSIEKSIKQSVKNYGQLEGVLRLSGVEHRFEWPFILYLFAAIGAQTLSIRGSEKAAYGKLFEKLVLGSLLTILGFSYTNRGDASNSEKVFWLSDRGKKRESDATLLYTKGVGIRFDMGFIGPGNSEISLDKVSRFERDMEYSGDTYHMSTIIIVDRIGEKSRIMEMARNVDGVIVQMSMSHWIKDVCGALKEKINYDCPVASIKDGKITEYVKSEMKKIPLEQFIET